MGRQHHNNPAQLSLTEQLSKPKSLSSVKKNKMYVFVTAYIFGGFLATAKYAGAAFVQLCREENTGHCVGAWANSECTNIDFGGEVMLLLGRKSMTDMGLVEGVPFVSGYVAPTGYCKIHSEPDCEGLSAIMSYDIKQIFPFKPESMSCNLDLSVIRRRAVSLSWQSRKLRDSSDGTRSSCDCMYQHE
ncbi:hypothetical protein L249_6711, partial [Ophiocordyceps polyrhachis-furcata BCC 54312]